MTRALSECIRDFPSCSQLCVKFLCTRWFWRWVFWSRSLGWRIIAWWSRITKRNEDVFLGSATAASRHNTTLIHLPQRHLLLHNLWIHLFGVLFSLATWTEIIVFVDEMMMCTLIDWFDTISVYSQDLSGCTLLSKFWSRSIARSNHQQKNPTHQDWLVHKPIYQPWNLLGWSLMRLSLGTGFESKEKKMIRVCQRLKKDMSSQKDWIPNAPPTNFNGQMLEAN